MKAKKYDTESKLSQDELAEIKADMSREKEGSFVDLIWRYAKKYWVRSVVILVAITIAAISVAITPVITQELMKVAGNIIDPPVGPGQPPLPPGDLSSTTTGTWGMTWKQLVGLAIGAAVVDAVFVFISQYLAAMLGKQIEIDLRNEAVEKLIEEDMSYYSNKKIGDILTKVVSDTQIVGDQVAIVPVTFLNAVMTLIISLIMMFVVEWRLTLITIAVFAIVALGMGLSFAPLRKLNMKLRRTVTSLNGDVIDRINTIKLIKANGTERYEEERFNQLHKKFYDQAYDFNLAQALLITFLFVGINSVQVVVTIAAGLIYQNNTKELAVLVPTFIVSVQILIGPIMSLVRVMVGVLQASTSSRRMHAILTAPVLFNNRYRSQDGIDIKSLYGNIIFKDVEFAYPEKPHQIVFPKFNFTFEQGKSYAFVGETGSGKSTVSKLLLRFYDPTRGEILINNNINLKDVNLSSYLDHVGYVEQEPAIILGTVYDNIRYAKRDATDAQIIAASKKAKLHDLVMSWPDGYNTILGERGFMLSGGQKQRLVIARIFLKDPQLLILDEATSALDNIVEKEIQEQLDELMVGRTSITIAHRLSTIKNSNLILVLAPGKGVVEKGTFNELKNRPGLFQNLYEAGKTE
ncbi:ATP-binding cassette subfamily B protein [Entomoplasma freundtii]|uniref:ABC transporter ATP-binding protein n=1 Tax=Entomoplasma freundtii TaxID=74700 RepID=A0A2K8NRL9_9MOLU|nr:ABC transporter ATP-binding protein [Entomoplasma freundtii]ATZ16414.1 ABC transporter ATP-binding protein [Entomoplasma freundtii]TDY56547.1 ATP-binding cassette subfamily B protein [Entomoplasma freundtii]